MVQQLVQSDRFMLAQIPPEIVQAIPSKWVVYLTAGWVALQAAGRAYHAIRNGGGLISIWRGLLYGTNTPKDNNEQTKQQ